jgi:hypothetical protein
MSDTNNPDSLCRELLWHAGIAGGVDDIVGMANALAGMANALADMLARAADAERQAIIAIVRATEVGGYFNDPDGNEFYTQDANALREPIIDAIAARGKP